MGFLTVIYFNNGAVVGKGTTAYNTMDEAEIQYHVSLSSAMGKADYDKVIAIVFDQNGEMVFRRVWAREV